MKLSKISVTIIIAGLLTYACSATSSPKPETETMAAKQDYESALAAAKSAQKKAASADGEWRDTASIVKKSEEAAEKGDFAEATKLADQAKLQGEMGYKQSIDQKSAGPRF
jgi:hypothetical protein